MLHDREIQFSAQDQRLAHDAVVENGLAVVGDRDGSGGLQRAEIGERGALAAAGRGRNGKHIDDGAALGLTQPLDPLDRIDNRNRIRHGADGSKSARSRSRGAGRNRLFVRLARLAQVHMQIDEAGRNDESAGIEFLVRAALDLVGRSHFGNAAIFQQHIHGRIDASRRVDEMATFDQQTTCGA